MNPRLIAFLLLASLFAAVASVRAQYPNIRVSNENDLSPDPEEVSIAINPKNLGQLAVGANIDYLFTSSDSGRSWSTKHMTSQYGFWGDPCVMFDDSGMLYYEHLSGHNWADTEFLWRIVVQHSTDGGMTFDSGAQIGLDPPTMQDKAWLGLDRSPMSSNGTITTSWNEDDRYGSRDPMDSDRIFFSKSTDHGMTWSERTRVDDLGGDCIDSSNTVEGATTAVGPAGDIYMAWSGRNKIYFDKSRDGGKTFGKDTVIADQPGGWDFKVPGISRANGFPMLLSDLNPQSPYYGRLYLMWSDQRRGVTDVYFMYSELFGATWSAPIRVNTDDALNHHFFPSMTLDPVTGHIFIVFYDRRNYTTTETDVYLAASSDGGQTFSNTKVSESAFLPADTVFFGDYIHVTAYNRHVFPVWMRMDAVGEPKQNHTNVWTAIVMDTMGLPDQTPVVISEETLSTTQSPQAAIEFTIPRHERVEIALFDLLGRRITTLLAGEYGAGPYRIGVPSTLAPGTYFVRMTTISETIGSPEGFATHSAKLVITQ